MGYVFSGAYIPVACRLVEQVSCGLSVWWLVFDNFPLLTSTFTGGQDWKQKWHYLHWYPHKLLLRFNKQVAESRYRTLHLQLQILQKEGTHGYEDALRLLAGTSTSFTSPHSRGESKGKFSVPALSSSFPGVYDCPRHLAATRCTGLLPGRGHLRWGISVATSWQAQRWAVFSFGTMFGLGLSFTVPFVFFLSHTSSCVPKYTMLRFTFFFNKPSSYLGAHYPCMQKMITVHSR